MFYFEVTGIDKEEVEMRVADHVKRGWQVHKRHEIMTGADAHIPQRNGRVLFGGERQFKMPESYKRYVVVLKRGEEHEKKEQKQS